ncbi:uncharacterized protein F5891DRAFT_1012615 [Suillus fuscotomentosus]|uniref:BRCA2 OB1 domain-containing protein n=1 Tax=Suillus fuscotomentosus TaxID=1912939 RepID=A0AAD4HQ64_9AGAM|nr:uncharacterized protein F5891DRAFT_1012615 [Suillus fuscotomentosus]KAG1904752.1 hypothetical protein F5891DRAFT_1012615 [Suillus fuscotomentosus]
MYNLDSSPSPPRKKMRMSSPTYDEQVDDMSQDDISAFDAIEARLSQPAPPLHKLPLPTNSHRRLSPGEAGDRSTSSDQDLLLSSQDIASQDDNNPFASDPFADSNATKQVVHPSFSKASAVLPPVGFKSASALPTQNADDSHRSPSPEVPPEIDYSSWFTSAPPATFLGFQSASSRLDKTKENVPEATVSHSTPIGFTSVGKGNLIMPSTTALRKAEEKIKLWQEEIDDPSSSQRSGEFAPSSSARPSSPQRTVLGAVHNSLSPQVPDTPTPAMATRRSFEAAARSTLDAPTLRPIAGIATSTYVNSPLNPHRQSFTSASSHMTPSSSAVPGTPIRPSPSVNTGGAFRPLGLTPRNLRGGPVKNKFMTPFKPGVKPLDLNNAASTPPSSVSPSPGLQRPMYPPSATQSPRPVKKAPEKGTGRVFNLVPPAGRMTLVNSSLTPQAYTTAELEDRGINVTELSQITPATALFYTFYTPSATPNEGVRPSDAKPLGPTAALEELYARGCSLATQEWINNHWPLILWKLAGMVSLEPEAESDPDRKRWCWPEVIRQLLYRYERDLNGSTRPPLRLITTKDAPAASPMVLCVSNVTWSPVGETDDGFPIPSHPELEVTDGWYRLRARVDKPLARAIRKGHIKIGRKIAVTGARLSAERKDGQEVLEAYDSSVLVLTGNSSHMAPWHAKLGFQRSPFIAMLNSLTADGGNVAVAAVEIIKIHPVAYIEFFEDENGKRMEGPRSAKDESALSEQWKRKREVAASKIWSDLERRAALMMGFVDRLEQRVGPGFDVKSEEMPDNLDDLYESLEESDRHQAQAILSRLSRLEAGSLAAHIREKLLQDREAVAGDIERELQDKCPAREVRSFRGDIGRKAQLTVWDVLNLLVAEGSSAGEFKLGQKFLVTNLMPKQISAWMDRGPGSEVYLATTKNSRWKRLA